MRVVVNQMTVRGRKTGVGHYVAELLSRLGAQAGEDRIEAYPPAWLGRAQEVWQQARSYLAPAPANLLPDVNQLGYAVPVTLHRQAIRGLGQAGQQMAACYFRARYRHPKYHLYHEPNFLPLPCDLPTVVTLHDLSVLLHPEWHPLARVAEFEKRFRQSLGQCAHFLTPTEFCRQEVIRHLGLAPAMVTCTYEGPRSHMQPLPEAWVRSRLAKLKLPARYLLHVGTIEPRKNLLLLMKAYCGLPALVRAKCPLVLAGGWGWNTRDLAEYYDAEGRHRGVLLTGYVADDDLATLYNGALALAFPSHYEGFGLPPLEMLACGGAVLSSTAGALVETVGGQAHLLDAGDLDGWRRALGRIIVDEEWRQSLRLGAVEAARDFTWERCAADTLRVYRMICGVSPSQSQPASRAA